MARSSRISSAPNVGHDPPATRSFSSQVQNAAFDPDLVLVPKSRNPIVLEPNTVQSVLRRPVFQFQPSATSAPRTTILVVTFDTLLFTRLCLESVLLNTELPIEIVVVDNASTDGTPEYLHQLAELNPAVRVYCNKTNTGFAGANNMGIRHARGESIVLLNNDTIVPRGWLQPLLSHLEEPEIGLIGPSTNRIGNEAEIPVEYRTLIEFERFAASAMHAGKQKERSFDIRTAAMFCVAARRSTLQSVGPLDEQFGLGMFEDDDYSMRVRQTGKRVVCSDESFVHHFGQASFGKLSATDEYGPLFHRNRARWERKWGRTWEPYERRTSKTHTDLVTRVRSAVNCHVPLGAKVLMISKGENELLNLGSHHAEHFPQDECGNYAGFHPADSHEAIERLQRLQKNGAEYLVIPSSYFWWLNFYDGLQRHLNDTCSLLHQDCDCVIYKLDPPAEH